jgi:hypothetical protein
VAFVEVGTADEQSYGCLLGTDLPEDEFACVTSDYSVSSALLEIVNDML